jgi:hypothetical protein
MAKYVLAYTGGNMGASPEEQQAIMDKWMGWFGSLGADLVDGGNPFGPSATVTPSGSSDGGASSLTGYTIITAADLAAATETAKGCPALAAGGSVEVYEAVEIG